MRTTLINGLKIETDYLTMIDNTDMGWGIIPNLPTTGMYGYWIGLLNQANRIRINMYYDRYPEDKEADNKAMQEARDKIQKEADWLADIFLNTIIGKHEKFKK
jgi:hypothetical protein